MAREHSDAAETTRCLDEALAGTFPASDPPAMTSPVVATPSADMIADTSTAPLRIYRVVKREHAVEPFAPTDSGGRWSPPGRPCVYASMTAAGALLEYLAHQEPGAAGTPELVLAEAEMPAGTTLSECNEPSTWRETPYRPEVQQVGAEWLGSRRSLALRVPSALVQGECNILLDPDHPGFAALQLHGLVPLVLDRRLQSGR